MKIHHQGWNDTVGVFNCDVILDETKCNYKIFFTNGMVYHQCTPFEHHATERSGQPCYRLGAYFEHNSSREFFTPGELASLALNGYALIPGLRIKDLQENLDDRIRYADRRAKALAAVQAQIPSHSVSAHTL